MKKTISNIVLAIIITLAFVMQPINPVHASSDKSPKVVAYCHNGTPAIKISNIPNLKDLWMELDSFDGTRAIFVYYGNPTDLDKDYIVGGINDIRGYRAMELHSGEKYFIRGWIHEYTNERPIIHQDQFIFDLRVTTPDCSKK